MREGSQGRGDVLCVITSPTTPKEPSFPTAMCAALGFARSITVQPRKLRAQYRLRTSWLVQNSL
jgi:hypothetical protein